MTMSLLKFVMYILLSSITYFDIVMILLVNYVRTREGFDTVTLFTQLSKWLCLILIIL